MAKDGIVIDRSRITHGQRNRAMLMQMQLRKADRDLDVDTFEHLLRELDVMTMQVVVSVPDGWLPDGVTLLDDDWITKISEEHYNEIIQKAQPPAPGEKKA